MPDSRQIRLLTRTLRLLGLLLAGVVICAVVVVAWLSRQPSVESDARARTLVRLGGLPEPISDASRLRVVVADLALASGSRPDAPRWMDIFAYSDQMNALAREVAMYQPDIAVLYNVIFSGDRAHGVAGGEFIAVEADMPWRVELHQWNARFSLAPLFEPANWPGEIVAGTLVLSRFPIERHTTELGAAHEGPARSGSVRAILDSGPAQQTIVEVFDGVGSTSAAGAAGPRVVRITRDPTGNLTVAESDNQVSTEHLQVFWGTPGARLQSQNTTYFHDNLDRPIVMAEFRWADPMSDESAAPEGSTAPVHESER